MVVQLFAYIVRRVIAGVVMLIVMSMITFLLFFSGGLHPERYACGKNCSVAQWDATKKALGYDKPVPVQWVDFAKGVVAGRDYPSDKRIAEKFPEMVSHCAAPCLGYSKFQTANVTDILKPAIPISASLAFAAFLIWMTLGISMGVLAALKKGTIIDRGVVGIALIVFAFPTFFTGLLLLKYLAIRWELFSIPSYVPFAESPGSWLVGLILPGLTLALIYIAGYLRMTRAYVLESMGEDYVRTATAKGLPRKKVVYKHTMRAALTPLVTMAGLDLAGLMGGAIITENVFNYQGLGKVATTAVRQFDLPVIVGTVLILATFVIIANIIVDISYAFIDPRVRLS